MINSTKEIIKRAWSDGFGKVWEAANSESVETPKRWRNRNI
jgi:hypothetical protein